MTLHFPTTTTTATLISLQLQLKLQLRYTTLHPAVVGEVTIETIATTPKKTQFQPLFGPSVDSLCHPCVTTTHLSYSVLSLKLPPPPCAVALVYFYVCFFMFFVCLFGVWVWVKQ